MWNTGLSNTCEDNIRDGSNNRDCSGVSDGEFNLISLLIERWRNDLANDSTRFEVYLRFNTDWYWANRSFNLLRGIRSASTMSTGNDWGNGGSDDDDGWVLESSDFF